jgi:hypothetical protein
MSVQRDEREPDSYADFRTGLTYRDVYGFLWSGSDDPSTWRYKRRHTVLGLWRQLKQQLYCEYLDRWDSEQKFGNAA